MTEETARALAEAMADTEFRAAMERFARDFGEYRSQLPAIPFAYTRTRLLVTPRFEVVAMQWSAGSTSPIHDHGESRCWVVLLEGVLEVENYVRDGEPHGNPVVLRHTGRVSLGAGDIDYRFGPQELHRVSNPGSESAFSLQLYAAPIRHYTIVDAHTRQGRLVDAICDLDLTPD